MSYKDAIRKQPLIIFIFLSSGDAVMAEMDSGQAQQMLLVSFTVHLFAKMNLGIVDDASA